MQLMMLLGKDMLLPDGRFDRSKMAQKVFSDPKLLESVNKIVHPAVKRYVNEDIKRLLESENSPDFYVFEAALLLEEGYDELLDDMWYIYTDENERIRRLSESRSMSAVRARSIMASQLPDEVFRERCDIVIDNSKGFYYTENQINFRIEVLRSDKT